MNIALNTMRQKPHIICCQRQIHASLLDVFMICETDRWVVPGVILFALLKNGYNVAFFSVARDFV